MFYIDDESHAEIQKDGLFSLQEALTELKARAEIPWDHEPNRAPCVGWMKCGRTYEIVEYDETKQPWEELRRFLALEVSAKGVKWSVDPDALDSH